MFGTIILWILAIIGGLGLLLWIYIWLTAEKEVKKIKKRKDKGGIK